MNINSINDTIVIAMYIIPKDIQPAMQYVMYLQGLRI